MTKPTTTHYLRPFGVRVDALQPAAATDLILSWLVSEPKFHYICSTNLNNILQAKESPSYAEVMEKADMSIPDGVPLLWYGRLKGFDLKERCGIEEIMLNTFELSNKGHEYTHYFYGNTEEVLSDLKTQLLKEYPKLKIAGMRSPPFRPLTSEEQELELKTINDSKPDFLWVSLGCPKQEAWLFNNRLKLNAVVAGGAGAVFNFFSGHTPRAPKLVRLLGMEWLMRLILEPKRLFRRYVIGYPKLFLYYWPKMMLDKKKTDKN